MKLNEHRFKFALEQLEGDINVAKFAVEIAEKRHVDTVTQYGADSLDALGTHTRLMEKRDILDKLKRLHYYFSESVEEKETAQEGSVQEQSKEHALTLDGHVLAKIAVNIPETVEFIGDEKIHTTKLYDTSQV